MLSISSPVGGSEIGVATVVEGTATPRASVELYIDGTLEQRTRADKSGRFRAAVSGLEPNTQTLIEVRELDAQGEVLSTSSVTARVVAESPAPAVSEPAVVERPAPATTPQPERDPVISDDSSRSASPKEIEAPVGQLARGAISTGAGFLGGMVGGFVGLMFGAAVAIVAAADIGFAALGYLGLGAIAGYVVAMPLSVYVTGYLLDGDGNFLATILASLAGLAGGALVLGALSEEVDSNGTASTALTVGFLLAGPAAGALVFELTSNPSRRAAKQGISMTPLVAPTADGRGAVVGLGGTW